MVKQILRILITLGVLIFLSSCATTGASSDSMLFNEPGPSSDLYGFEGG